MSSYEIQELTKRIEAASDAAQEASNLIFKGSKSAAVDAEAERLHKRAMELLNAIEVIHEFEESKTPILDDIARSAK